MTTNFDDLLLNVPLFTGLEQADLAEILLTMRPFSIAEGEVLMHQGDPADGMYLLESGQVRVTARVPGNEVVDFGLRGPGSLIGEVSLLDRGSRSANVIATQATTGHFFDARRFEMLRSDLSPGAFRLMERLYHGVTTNIRRLISQIAAAPISEQLGEQLSEQLHSYPAITVPDDGNNLWKDEQDDSKAPSYIEQPLSQVNHAHLQALPIFRRFNAEEMSEFLGMTSCWQVKRGEVLFMQNSTPRTLYIVLRGALRLSTSRAGTREQLSIYGPGKSAGHIALVDGLAHPGTCDVREDAMLLPLTKDTFDLLRQGNSTMAFKFMESINQAIAEQLRVVSRHVARMAADGSFEAESGSV